MPQKVVQVTAGLRHSAALTGKLSNLYMLWNESVENMFMDRKHVTITCIYVFQQLKGW